ncbi:hypothetical protein L211DRAFT_829356 [Terfezia boudieri ATCC MYA-4762]|uniref:Mannose-1-phosphate guanyltransferase n=1 Tax=Terfezia boudieri ATCC MYA-4762 TaxID=1051890 RepID=A0A3N4LIH4_9PEZI|nr:hypothetical protein L211DRAFT_829356 [Terfezia boudieri ATCC MYA-4762]
MPAVVGLGFQAVILCGGGTSLYPYTQPDDMPKALLPVANRPMVYYALDYCEKAGVKSILILTLQEHHSQIQSHFKSSAFTSTSLNHYWRNIDTQIEAPSSLNDSLQSADVLRVAHSKLWIKGDFIVLPCDIVAQGMGLSNLVQVWMLEQAAFGGGGSGHRSGEDGRDGRRGMLGVWYGVGGEGAVKGQETDALIVTPARTKSTQALYNSFTSAASFTPSTTTVHSLLQTHPPAALKGITDSSDYPIRHSLLSRHPQISLRTHTHRDAHIYIFPHWVLEFIKANPKLNSLKDDVIPWLAKCTWQKGLGEKMGLEGILTKRPRSAGNDGVDNAEDEEEDFDVGGRSTTQLSNLKKTTGFNGAGTPPKFVSGVTGHKRSDSHDTTGNSTPTPPQSIRIPKITAVLTPQEYAVSATPPTPFIRRVDTPQLFRETCLQLAKTDVALPGQPATSANTVEAGADTHAQPKIDPTCNIAEKTTITSQDCLLGPNCTVMEKCIIKRCVLGPNVTIRKGVRLMDCVLLEGCVIEENVKLDKCILGRGARVGKGSDLRDCEIGHGYGVEEETEARGERLVVLDGVDDEAVGSGWGSDEAGEDYSESESEKDEEEEESDDDEKVEEAVTQPKKAGSSTSSLTTPASMRLPLPISPTPQAGPDKKVYVKATSPSGGENVVSRFVNLPTGTVIEKMPVGRAKEEKSGGEAAKSK